MGLRYDQGEVAHLDLVQEATNPTWSRLRDARPAEHVALRSGDLPFLRWELETFPLDVLICNGRGIYDEVCDLVSGKIVEMGSFRRINWHVSVADLAGRKVWLVGWNIPLARPTGLGQAGQVELGKLLAARVH
jgi:hypothetical protein